MSCRDQEAISTSDPRPSVSGAAHLCQEAAIGSRKQSQLLQSQAQSLRESSIPTATLLRSMQKAVGLLRRAFLGCASVFVYWRVGGVKCKVAVSCPTEVNKMTI